MRTIGLAPDEMTSIPLTKCSRYYHTFIFLLRCEQRVRFSHGANICIIIFIISPGRCPLLDIGLTRVSPQRLLQVLLASRRILQQSVLRSTFYPRYAFRYVVATSELSDPIFGWKVMTKLNYYYSIFV